MFTRKSIADHLDAYDDQITDLQDSKREMMNDYRAQLAGNGFGKAAIKAEIDGLKVAMRRRRAIAKKGEEEIEQADAIADEIFLEITSAPRAPRATRENIEEFPDAGLSYSQSGLTYANEKGRGAGERLIDAAREMRGMVGELTDTQESDQPDEADVPATAAVASDEMAAQDDVGATASSTYSPERANEVPAQDGGGTALDASHGDKSNAARPASVDAHVNGGRLAGEVSVEAVTVVGDESGTLTNSHSQASSSQPANSAGEAPSSSPASPARHSDDDIPAFIKQDKPGCLKLKDGHCRISFATSALCAECNQHRAISRASA